MAKIALEVEVKSEEGAKSLKDLKRELKDLQTQISETKQGSEEYYNTLKKIGSTKDEIEDLQETIAATTGAGKFQAIANIGSQIANGFQLAQGAMAMFGTESEAVTQSLQKAQAAMAFVQGIKELEGLGDAMKNAKMVIIDFAKNGISALRSLWAAMLSNPITAILIGLTALAAGIAALMAIEDDETGSLRENIAQRERSIDAMNRENDTVNKNAKFRTDLLKAQGASEKEIFAAEQENRKIREQQLVKENKMLYDQLKQLGQLRAKADDDERKELTDKINSINDKIKKNNEEKLQFERDFQIKKAQLATNDRKAEEERQKEAAEKAKEIAKKKAEERAAEEKRIRTSLYKDDINAIQQKTVTENQIQEEGLKISNDIDAFWKAKMDERDQYYAQKKSERQERNKQFAISATLETLQVIQDLTSAFAGKSEAAQKRAFNINKAAQIAEATISTVLAAQKAYTSQLVVGDPTSPVRGAIAAALAVAAGVARVKKIASTQFEGGGGSGAGGGMAEAGGGTGGAISAPIQGGVNNTSTMLENLNKPKEDQKPVKAYVLQTDVANENQKIKAIENKAKIE